jgi:hypothetical protein
MNQQTGQDVRLVAVPENQMKPFVHTNYRASRREDVVSVLHSY